MNFRFFKMDGQLTPMVISPISPAMPTTPIFASPTAHFFSHPPPKLSLEPLCLYCLRRFRQADFLSHLIGHALPLYPCNECFVWYNGQDEICRHLGCFFREGIRHQYRKNGHFQAPRFAGGQPQLAVATCDGYGCGFCGENETQLEKHLDWCHRRIRCDNCDSMVIGHIGMKIHPCFGRQRFTYGFSSDRTGGNTVDTTKQRLPAASDNTAATSFGHNNVNLNRTTTPMHKAKGPMVATKPGSASDATNMAEDGGTIRNLETAPGGKGDDVLGKSAPAMKRAAMLPKNGAGYWKKPQPVRQEPTNTSGVSASASTSQSSTMFHMVPISSSSSSESESDDDDDDETWRILKEKLWAAPPSKEKATGPGAAKGAAVRRDQPTVLAAAATEETAATASAQSTPSCALPSMEEAAPPPIQRRATGSSRVKIEDQKEKNGNRKSARRDLSKNEYACKLCPMASIWKHSVKTHLNGLHKVPLDRVEGLIDDRPKKQAVDEPKVGKAGRSAAASGTVATASSSAAGTKEVGTMVKYGCPECQTSKNRVWMLENRLKRLLNMADESKKILNAKKRKDH